MKFLTPWEKLETDWQGIENELCKVPHFSYLIRKQERSVIGLYIPNSILPFPTMGGGIKDNSTAVLDFINDYRTKNNLPLIPKTSQVVWVDYTGACNIFTYHVKIFISIEEYCKSTSRSFEIIEELPPVKFKSCWFFHKWEEIADHIRSTKSYTKALGYMLGAPEGIQKAIFCCKKCGKRKTMYRDGFVGMEGYKQKWKTCPKWKEQQIAELPVM